MSEEFLYRTTETAPLRIERLLRATPEFHRTVRPPRIIFKRHPWSNENAALRYFKAHGTFPPETALSLSRDAEINPDGREQLNEDKVYMAQLFREYPSEFILLCSSTFARTREATESYEAEIFGAVGLDTSSILYDGRLAELILGPLETLIVAGREAELVPHLLAYFANKEVRGKAAYERRPALGILDVDDALDISEEYGLRKMIDNAYATADVMENMYADFEGESVIDGKHRFQDFLGEYREYIERPNQITIIDSHAGLILGAELELRYGDQMPEDLPSISAMTRPNCCYVEYEGVLKAGQMAWNLVHETRRSLEENFK